MWGLRPPDDSFSSHPSYPISTENLPRRYNIRAYSSVKYMGIPTLDRPSTSCGGVGELG